MTPNRLTLGEVRTLGDRIAGEIGKAVVGQTDAVRHLLIALFSGGHVLLEGRRGPPRPSSRNVSPRRSGSISSASSSPPI